MANKPQQQKQKKARDPRVTVIVGTLKSKSGGNSRVLYSRMKKSTADFFGFTQAPNAVYKGQNGKPDRLARGSVGAGSIKVILESTTKSGSPATKSIPIPSQTTNIMIKKFLQGAKNNKPKQFVTRDGLTFDIASTTAKK